MEMALIVVAFLMAPNDGHSQIQTQSEAKGQTATIGCLRRRSPWENNEWPKDFTDTTWPQGQQVLLCTPWNKTEILNISKIFNLKKISLIWGTELMESGDGGYTEQIKKN